MVPHTDPAARRDSDFLMQGVPMAYQSFLNEQAAGALRE